MTGLGLGDYGSSDEDEDQPVEDLAKGPGSNTTLNHLPSNGILQPGRPTTSANTGQASTVHIYVGPVKPPGTEDTVTPGGQVVDGATSPYVDVRQQVRDLTMPPFPNFEIPPSPPPSDDPDMAARNKKVAHFLALTREGTHFNEKLLESSASRNAAVTDKLLVFAGVEGIDQYRSALPDGLGVDVEHWASLRVEEIVAKVEQRRKAHAEARKGSKREFVPASARPP